MPTFPPPGRIAFGVSASERYVVIVGGHTFDNVPLSSAFMFDMETMEQGWQHLPAYPHPILAPGVTICHDRVIVIGGCDFLMGRLRRECNRTGTRTFYPRTHRDGCQSLSDGVGMRLTCLDGRHLSVDLV